MANPNSIPFQPKAIFMFLVILALTITSTTSRRILDEVPATPTVAQEAPGDTDEAPVSRVAAGTGAATPVGAGDGVAAPVHAGDDVVAPVVHAGVDHPATAGAGAGTGVVTPVNAGDGVTTPVGAGAGVAAPAVHAGADHPTTTGAAAGTGAVTPVGVGAGIAAPAAHAGVAAPAVHAGADHPAAAGAVAAGGAGEDDHIFSFFMHDILGGSNPSAIAVTGIATNPSLSGQVPFAKPNGAVLAVDNGVPVNSNNNGIISNNNIPFLTGLSGTTPNVIQNNGNNNNNNIIGGGSGYPALNLAQLGSGVTFQKLMFGTMTVFDDELTESHELNSGLVGKAQGFYISSSEDGTSQTMAFTVMFHSGSYSDSLSFFGVHRVRVSESHLAIMGGTGKYVNAKGFATVKTFPTANQQTDGVETLLHITVYLAY